MKKVTLFSAVFVFFSLLGCENEKAHIITVKNTLDIARSFETVEINKTDLKLNEDEGFDSFSVKDLKTNEILISQSVDNNQDGTVYELVAVDNSNKPKTLDYCYSRFVPERTDDYAWENNKVGFRTFGPTAQKMVEDKVKGGTLSSGIDAWLKRVDYPIINKWYKKAETEKGAYHKDSGEGLDNFHVGVSRGVGGIAVKTDTTYHISKNFTSWKTITTGPIRTSFVLEYADWDAKGKTITETKHISLDYGNNLSRFEIELTGTDAIYAGLTLHEKDGESTHNKESGWVSYWEPHDDSELGTAIVVPDNNMLSSELFDTPLKDWSNLYAQIKVNKSKTIYYAGFAWKKAGEFTSKEAWNAYLENFSKKKNNPLKVSLN